MAIDTGFYHLDGLADAEIADAGCRGTACFVARHRDEGAWAAAQQGPPVHCLGRCYEAPVRGGTVAGTIPAHVDAPAPVVLERVAAGGARTLDAYAAAGGWAALDRALAKGPEWLLDEVEQSQMRGRGGAAFPTGRKWRTVRESHRHRSGASHVVCNADEGDPGAYIDRALLEDDPFAVLEGLALAAVAVGAGHGVVYVRREYPAARDAIARAVADATAAGILGPASPITGDGFHVEVVEGRGSYLCGEETALLNALEGRRPQPRVRPPYPAEHGLHGEPTAVNNVETLASIPWITSHGGAAYAAMGRGTSRGTKVVSLNSLFRRPGLYEVELGTTVRRIVEQLGGGLAEGHLQGVLIGGPLAGIVPPPLLDTPLTVEDLRAIGADVGHGGVVAFDHVTTIAALVQQVFAFGSFESCGLCTPCRVGTGRIEQLAHRVVRGHPLSRAEATEWRRTVEVLQLGSLCGHGSGLAAFARSVDVHFPGRFGSCRA